MLSQRRIAHRHEASRVEPKASSDARFQRTTVHVKEDPEQVGEKSSEAAALEKQMEDIASSNPLGDPIDNAEVTALQEEMEKTMEDKKKVNLTPAKMQAIEAELSSVMSGMMTSVVSNILTQEPRIVRLAKRQKTEL